MFEYAIPTRLRVIEGNGASFEAQVVGLVTSGVWIQSDHALPFRAPVTLEIAGDRGPPLRLRAEVVATAATGLGFEVTEPHTSAAFEALSAWAAGHPAQIRADFRPSLDWIEGSAARVRTPFLPLSGIQVAVVEDEPAVAKLLSTALSKRGAEVTIARDGAEALELIGARHQAVLLDWMVPKLAGDQVLRGLRERFPELPIAIVSGVMQSVASRAVAMQAGAETVFVKPFKVMMIIEWVEKVTGVVP